MKLEEQLENYFELDAKQLVKLINPIVSPFPELELLRADLQRVKDSPQMKIVYESSSKFKEDIDHIPELSPELYEEAKKTGDRDIFLKPYDLRREKASVATLFFLLGETEYQGMIEKYLIAMCEEPTWIPPHTEGRLIDLWSSDTSLNLATIVVAMGKNLNTQVIQKVRDTIEERIFKPYLEDTSKHAWYQKGDNWNAVCNSQVACTFLLLENDHTRKARAIETALKGLKFYIDTAFNADGASSEGVHYWHYGMRFLTIFSEMLRSVTEGKIDLLSIERVKQIAAFPAKMQLSRSTFISFSDSNETGQRFHPGIIQRLFERTGETTLLNLIYDPKLNSHSLLSLFTFLFWWDGTQHEGFLLKDSLLPVTGVARLTSTTPNEKPLIVAIKAGNNDENHNHNDIGSFILNLDGESLLVDPGSGPYDMEYFGEKRYEYIFANSYGHSVPRIDGQLQSFGKKYAGTLAVKQGKDKKDATVDFTHAYDISNLKSAVRRILFPKTNVRTVILEDTFEFAEKGLEIEEALMTWSEVEVEDRSIIIKGEHATLHLSVETSGVSPLFKVEDLRKESIRAKKDQILKRISISIPPANAVAINIRIIMTLLHKGPELPVSPSPASPKR